MNLKNTLLLSCALAILVTACGQRGPLVLPEPETRSEVPPSPAEEQEKKDEKNSGT